MINELEIKNWKLKIVLVILFSLIFNLKSVPSAHAQTPQKGITVTPSIEHLDLASDKPEYELTYFNNTQSEINLKLSVRDFTELEDTYRLYFLSGNDAASYKYSLSSWITFENDNVLLAPGEKKSIKVFIDKDRITKGGHYASILAEIVQPDVKGQVSVKAVLSALLFVRASTGQEVEEGKITDFKPLRDGIDYPDAYTLSFENNGNVPVPPYGLAQVYDPLGNLVATGILNDNSLDALPESIRHYQIKVNTIQKVLIPGFYTTKIQVHFGKTNQKLTATVRFFSQGAFNFVKVGFFLIAVIALIIYRRRNKQKAT